MRFENITYVHIWSHIKIQAIEKSARCLEYHVYHNIQLQMLFYYHKRVVDTCGYVILSSVKHSE